MPRGIPTINYLRAVQIMFGKWYSVNSTDYTGEDGETEDYILPSPALSVEQKIIKMEMWESLSKEAKEVVIAIISSPDEILEIFITPQREIYSRKRIKKYFTKLWHSKFISDITIQEITTWVKQL
ncbi:hypothetical protein DRH13_01790 [Candidatus Woesebacteria bacterium]|nr:MAG: hypothetical protein DRH13_01790 [Candidatus Woesebacteria bacterium]